MIPKDDGVMHSTEVGQNSLFPRRHLISRPKLTNAGTPGPFD